MGMLDFTVFELVKCSVYAICKSLNVPKNRIYIPRCIAVYKNIFEKYEIPP